MARKLIEKGKPHKAFRLMKSYGKDHPDDFNTAWLYAKTAYLANRISVSGKQYRKAIRLSPGNLYARLDYADYLVNTGRFEQAQGNLDAYLAYDKGNYKALVLKSKIDYWQSDYKAANQKLDKIPGEYSGEPDVTRLRNDINLAESPWLGINGNFFADNQPLQCYNLSASAGLFLHPHASPYIRLAEPLFDADGVYQLASWIQVGNRSVFAKPGMNLDLSLGFIKFPSANTYSWSGSAELSKTFFYHLPVSLTVCQNPYFSTLGSIDARVFEDHITLTAGWDRQTSWYGQATVDYSFYPIDNSGIYSGNGWVFAPPVSLAPFTFRVGYGFAYSNADVNQFVAEKTVDEIISDYSTTTEIKGVYVPYFTPRNQQVHSLLIGIQIHPGKVIRIGLNANFGLMAMADIPYLFLDKDANGTVFINKGYSYQHYTPIEATGKIAFRISNTVNLEADYTFSSTYFYIRNYTDIGLKIRFADGRK